ncbi:flavodoxin family protein [Desulfovibrio sp. JC010]|uniref:flavodoxin family protein n=1 Tax=Desulfovibrio sp. JC010 TaxID=2593641 RepID=UPI0013D5CF1D|nr:flavodoxin family protein [Desulfovibrio sp. JC010]NDV26789.1 flavodoxin family protein [Desulfovibrio sp. JC010]
MKILNLYGSLNGQTEKVALEIEKEAVRAGHEVSTFNLKKEGILFELLDYDLTFIGSGVYTWLPGKAVQGWIDRQLMHARDNNLILPGSPRIPGKFACVYCTYAGPHTGEAEAVPAIKYMGQLFDHLGITVADEWAVVGSFVPKKMQHFNTSGRLGDIEGRPNADDLKQVRGKVAGLLGSLEPCMV